MAMPAGLAAGDAAPDVNFFSGVGETVALRSLVGDKKAAVVVFYHFAFEDG